MGDWRLSQNDADRAVIAQALELELRAAMANAEPVVVVAHERVTIKPDIGSHRLGPRPIHHERRLDSDLVRLDAREADDADHAPRARRWLLPVCVTALQASDPSAQ